MHTFIQVSKTNQNWQAVAICNLHFIEIVVVDDIHVIQINDLKLLSTQSPDFFCIHSYDL